MQNFEVVELCHRLLLCAMDVAAAAARVVLRLVSRLLLYAFPSPAVDTWVGVCAPRVFFVIPCSPRGVCMHVIRHDLPLASVVVCFAVAADVFSHGLQC